MVVTMSNGIIWALLGAAIATGVAGIGSIRGVGMAAETAMGAMSECWCCCPAPRACTASL